ncbi:uncharacterized protein [Cicer arietinum]|uniref:uncharacterized protein isoform X5 n=1 Tax=Cicer arietinum TaxID=3827 RepID=UPI003CC59A23
MRGRLVGFVPCAHLLLFSHQLGRYQCRYMKRLRRLHARPGLGWLLLMAELQLTSSYESLREGVDILVSTPGRLVDLLERASFTAEE